MLTPQYKLNLRVVNTVMIPVQRVMVISDGHAAGLPGREVPVVGANAGGWAR